MQRKILYMLLMLTILNITACNKSNINVADIESSNEAVISSEQTIQEDIQVTVVDEEKLREERFNSLVVEIESYAESGDFATALNMIETAMVEYTDKREVLEQMKALYREEAVMAIVVEADNYMVSDNSTEAFITLDKIRSEYIEYLDIYTERLNYYAKYLYLKEENNLINSKAFAYDDAYGDMLDYSVKQIYESRTGETYEDFIMFIISQTNNKNAKPYVMYKLSNDYRYIDITLVCSAEIDEDKAFHMEIYGDDKLLHTTETITSFSGLVSFTVDINNADFVKLVCVREDHNLSIATEQPSMAIVNLIAYNEEVEFDYYIESTIEDEYSSLEPTKHMTKNSDGTYSFSDEFMGSMLGYSYFENATEEEVNAFLQELGPLIEGLSGEDVANIMILFEGGNLHSENETIKQSEGAATNNNTSNSGNSNSNSSSNSSSSGNSNSSGNSEGYIDNGDGTLSSSDGTFTFSDGSGFGGGEHIDSGVELHD